MIRTHFGMNMDRVHKDLVFRYSDEMSPHLGESADTLYFLVHSEPNRDTLETTEQTRQVSDGKDNEKTITQEFKKLMVRVTAFRWDADKRMAVREISNPFTKTIFFSVKDQENPNLVEVENATVAKSDSRGILALRVPTPKTTPRVAVAQA